MSNIIKRTKFPNSYMLKYAILEILSGLFIILTLGFYTCGLTLPFVMNYHQKKIKNKIKTL